VPATMPQTPFRATPASRRKGKAGNETRRRLAYAAGKWTIGA